DHHSEFPKVFRGMVRTLQMCHRRKNCPLAKLPESILFYIVNFCAWDWAGTPEELKIKDKNEHLEEAVRLKRERDLNTAVNLERQGLIYMRGNNFAMAAQKFSTALELLRAGLSRSRLKLSAKLYSHIATCCTRIANGEDLHVRENLQSLPEAHRGEARRILRTQCLEQAIGYSRRAIAKASDDTKLKIANHLRAGSACLAVCELRPCQAESYAEKAAKHFNAVVEVDSNCTEASEGVAAAQAILRRIGGSGEDMELE
ncbi:hypothetical protein AAMO2058_000645900, partial [Amorphochlora amoebiformis]